MKIKAMKKKYLLSFVCVMLAFCFCACGKKNTGKSESDVIAIANELKASKVFSVEMVEINEKILLNEYDLNEETKVLFAYVGDGVSAEELTVLKGNALDNVIDKYLEEKEKTYESYLPEDANKVSKAIVKKYGDIYLICICNDKEEAEEIIQKN